MARTRAHAAGVAALVAALAIAAAPASAPAQVRLPPVDLSETLSKPVDDVEQAVEDQLATIAPGVVDSGQPEQANPAQGANQADPLEPAAGDPGPDPAPAETASGNDAGAGGPQANEPARAARGGDGAGQAGTPPPTDTPRSRPAPEPSSSQPSPARNANERGPGVLERLVSFVPTPVKVAVGLLGALLAIAAFVAWRTRRRLRTAERRAATDALTGLPNRRSAEEVLARLVAAAQRNGRALSVVLFDLDHFKAINDNHGHATGDEALRTAARATRDALRASDHVARFGGEEFLVMLPETGRDDALLVAENLRAAIAGVAVEGTEKGVTASFGVAVYPGNGASAEELVVAADQALYRAKEAGRDRVEIADPAFAAVAAAA